MRIITGTARGTRLSSPEGEEITRPTTEKVKEAVFSSIQFDIEGREVLDLFAGSGQMGLEALSRGAEKCTFVDNSREAIKFVTENAQKTKLYKKSNVLCMDFEKYAASASGKSSFDIVFIDPPYAKRLLPSALKAIYDSKLVKETSIIICEDEQEGLMEDTDVASCYTLTKQAHYGRVIIYYLAPKAAE